MLCKINTVITRLNKNSVLDLCDWVKNIGGIYRWKIFQFLPSIGTAKLNSNKLALEIEEFNSIKGNIRDSMQRWSGQLIFEDINFLSNSYISIDPHGNFYTAIKKDNEYRIVVLGHVLDMSIEQLINHPLLNKDNLVARCQFNSNYFKTINKI
jgi:MoaA/NifB/PqqE/SkfB family radical SAM enzyme